MNLNSLSNTSLALLLSLLTASTLLSGCTYLGESPINLGLGLVSTTSDFKGSEFQGRTDDTGNGGTAFVGIDPGRPNRVVWEGGYTWGGETTFNGTFNGTPDRGDIQTDLVSVNVGYKYLLGERFSVTGRVGATYSDVDESEVFGGTPERHSASGLEPSVGALARYHINDRWSLGLAVDRHFDTGEDGETGEGDYDVFGFRIERTFGR